MQKNILLVDDDASVRQMLRRVLAEEGYRVVSATRSAEALDSATASSMDLALLDLNLPGEDGWNIFEQLTKADPLLPIVIITARSNQLFRAVAAGAGALMEKPLDFPKLLGTIRDLINEPAAVRAARVAGRKTEFRYHPPTPDTPTS
jgi:two-component system phosphate regulon response regulator OmpR